MLKLSALHLENFGPFKGRQTIEFASDDGVQIVYGENMRGKTSLLNAIRFAFFGKVIGRGTRATGLHTIGNWEEAAIGNFGFKVGLEFYFDMDEYLLTRTCSTRVSDPVSEDDYTVDHYLERNGTVLGPDQSRAELKRILPEQISRFFLFDGELLQEYEDLLSSESDMGRRISDSIERILGVPILTSARATALSLRERSEKREAVAAQSGQRTREYGNQLADIHAHHDVLKADQSKLQGDLDELWTRKAVIEESMKRKERYASLMEKRDGIQRQLNELTDRQSLKSAELASAMTSAWTTLLGDRIQLKVEELTAHQKRLGTELMRWNVLQELKNNSSDACPMCLQQISPEVRAEIERTSAIDQGESEIIQKNDELTRTSRCLNALQSLNHADRASALKVRWDTTEEVALDIASRKGELVELNKQLEDVDEAMMRKDKSAFEKTVREIDAAERSLTKCQEDLGKNRTLATNLQKQLDKHSGGDLEGERKRRKLYSQMHDLFNEAVAAYRDQLRVHVEEDATRFFKTLTTEPDYAGLRINDNYGLTIVHRDGKDIPVRSAGAEHVVALSLVGALQNNAPLQGPIIIDSPFGRLDSGHKSNIVRSLPELAKQVVLLVYEDELPAGLAREELKGKLKAEWRLIRQSARHTQLERRRD